MRNHTVTALLIALIALLTTLLALAINFATAGQLPSFVLRHGNFSWPIVAVLTLLLIVLPVWQYKRELTAGSKEALRKSLISLIKLYEGEPWTRQAIRLKVKGLRSDGEDARDAIFRWLQKEEEEDFRLLVIAGDFGSGKTWLLRWFAYELSCRILRRHRSFPVPVMIPMYSLDQRKIATRRDLFELSDPPIGEFSPDSIAKEVIILLDGLDEMAGPSGHADESIKAALRTIAAVEPPSTRFVITCRTHNLETNAFTDSLRELTAPRDRLDATKWAMAAISESRNADFELLTILDVTPEQANDYMLHTKVAQTWQDVRDERAYQELTRVPLTMYLIEETLPQLREQPRGPERHELFETAIRIWLARFWIGQQREQQDVGKALIELEELAANEVRRNHIEVNDDYRRAGILSRLHGGGYVFRHYSLLEYFFARALRREFIAYKSDLLSRVNLLQAYGINRFLVPMMLSDAAADHISLTAEDHSHSPSALVSVKEFREFIKQTGWRRGGYSRWGQMRAPDGTIAMSAPGGRKEFMRYPRISSFSDIEGTEGPATGICWYDAFQFCRWTGGRLPNYEELGEILRGAPHTYSEWSSSWCQEPASWIAVAWAVPDTEGYRTVKVEMDGINPDLRFPDLGFRVIRDN